MNMNVCFVANFSKTFFFHELALQLMKKNVQIYWIVVRKDLFDFLNRHYSLNKIIYLNKSFISKKSQPIADLKLNELLYGDRVLKYDYKSGESFLINIQYPIKDFLMRNNISFVFGEVTWAHELLISRICNRMLHINYYSFQTIRVPYGRMCFFKDESQCEIVEANFSDIKFDLEDDEIRVEKPAYLKRNDSLLSRQMSFKGKISRLKRMLTNENIDNNDPCNISGGLMRYKIPFKEETNRLTYKFRETLNFDDVKDKKFIFFGFHKQPEASVDVCGRYYENQLMNVVNLWRQLPYDWFLIVKEHSNAVGDRGYAFFKQLKKFPRVLLVNEKIDSHMLIKASQLVATNTGTMALEAALMGKPAFTFSPVFFNKLNRCPHIGIDILRKIENIEDLLSYINHFPDNRKEYLTYVESNSFEGENGDLIFNPGGMNRDNIVKVSTAIFTIISSRSEKNYTENL